jgi:hypothetical protein
MHEPQTRTDSGFLRSEDSTMKSPTDDLNTFVYAVLAVFVLSLIAAFLAGVWFGVRL